MLLMCMMPARVAAQTAWNGTTATNWTGSGSESDPYLITTAEQLAGLAEAVNTGNDFSGKFIKLANDIVLSDPSAADDDKTEWMPIGATIYKNTTKLGGEFNYEIGTYIFKGTFDGGGHEVRNLYCGTVPDNSNVDDPFQGFVIDFSG